METTGIAMIVRSHEMVPEVLYLLQRFSRTINYYELIVTNFLIIMKGIAVNHDGRVVTIFSASNYYSLNSNKGAFLVFNSTSGEKRIVKFR